MGDPKHDSCPNNLYYYSSQDQACDQMKKQLMLQRYIATNNESFNFLNTSNTNLLNNKNNKNQNIKQTANQDLKNQKDQADTDTKTKATQDHEEHKSENTNKQTTNTAQKVPETPEEKRQYVHDHVLQKFDQVALEEALSIIFEPQDRVEHKFLLQQFAQWAEETHNPALAFPIIEGSAYSGMATTFQVKDVKAPVSTADNYATVINNITNPKRRSITKAAQMDDKIYDDYEFLKENGIVCNEAAKLLFDIAYANNDDKQKRNAFAGSNYSITSKNEGKNFQFENNSSESNNNIPLLSEHLENAVQGDAFYYWNYTDTIQEILQACNNDPLSPELTQYLIGNKLSSEIEKKIIHTRIINYIRSNNKYDKLQSDYDTNTNNLNALENSNSDDLTIVKKAKELEDAYNEASKQYAELRKLKAPKEEQKQAKKRADNSKKEYTAFTASNEFKKIKSLYETYSNKEKIQTDVAAKKQQLEKIETKCEQAIKEYDTKGKLPKDVSSQITPSAKPAHIETIFATKGDGASKEISTVGAHGTSSPNGINRTKNGKIEWTKISDLIKNVSANKTRIIRLYQIKDNSRVMVDFGKFFMEEQIVNYKPEMVMKEVELKDKLKAPKLKMYNILNPLNTKDQSQKQTEIHDNDVTDKHIQAAYATWEISNNDNLKKAISNVLKVKNIPWSDYDYKILIKSESSALQTQILDMFNEVAPKPNETKEEKKKRESNNKSHKYIETLFVQFNDLSTDTQKNQHDPHYIEQVAKSVFDLLTRTNTLDEKTNPDDFFNNKSITSITYNFDQQNSVSQRNTLKSQLDHNRDEYEKVNKDLKTLTDEKDYNKSVFIPALSNLNNSIDITNLSQFTFKNLKSCNNKLLKNKSLSIDQKNQLNAFCKVFPGSILNKNKTSSNYSEILDAMESSISNHSHDLLTYQTLFDQFFTAKQTSVEQKQRILDAEFNELNSNFNSLPQLITQRYQPKWSVINPKSKPNPSNIDK